MSICHFVPNIGAFSRQFFNIPEIGEFSRILGLLTTIGGTDNIGDVGEVFMGGWGCTTDTVFPGDMNSRQ